MTKPRTDANKKFSWTDPKAAGRNFTAIHTDSLFNPFDINGEFGTDGWPLPQGKGTKELPFATQCHRCFAEQGHRGTCLKCLDEMRERATLEMEVAVPR